MNTSKAEFDHRKIERAIAAAEKLTSGELRVVIYPQGAEDPVATAKFEFARMGMHRTRERNAVLILVAPSSRSFAVFGDEGVHVRCGDQFWKTAAEHMAAAFQNGDFTGGVVGAVSEIGDALAQHFPRCPDDQNELPDTVVERGVVI